jgi:hypothetical protein
MAFLEKAEEGGKLIFRKDKKWLESYGWGS